MGAVEDLGEQAQEKCVQLKASGMSHAAITDEMNKLFLTELTAGEVSSFLKRTSDKSFKVLKEEKGFETKMAKHYFSTLDKVNTLCDEMWELFTDLKTNPDYKEQTVICKDCGEKNCVQIPNFQTRVKVAEHLLNQIKHVDTILGRMQKQSINITYNVVDMSKKLNQVIPQLFQSAERRGQIKIKKNRLKMAIT